MKKIIGLLIINIALALSLWLIKIKSNYILNDTSTYMVEINLNGADSVDYEVLTCNKEITGKCEVTLPRAYRNGGEVLGYSKKPNMQNADYLMNEKITVTGNMTLYVVSKKHNKLHIEDSAIDYLSNNDLSCVAYNDESCMIILPIFNKKGLEIFGYGTKSSSQEEYFMANKYYLDNDTTLYPVYGFNSRYQSIDVVKSTVYDNSIFMEVEKGCKESDLSLYQNELTNIRTSLSHLYPQAGMKISLLKYNTALAQFAKNMSGITYNFHNNVSIDLVCNENNQDTKYTYVTMVHELAHNYEYNYYLAKGKWITEERDMQNIYDKYLQLFLENQKKCLQDGNGTCKMTTEDYYQRYNGVLTDYAFMGGIKEFWGEAVAYYYALFIKKDITYSYVKYPDDLKKVVEKYIS